MRALHVITGLGVGGAEQQLRLLLRALPVECEVAALTNPGAVADGLRADGVRVLPLRMGGNRDLGVLPRLVRLIRVGRYDLVHTHLYRACVYGRIAARLAGVRAVVATEHSLGAAEIEGRPLTRPTRELYLATERLGAATVAVSETVAGRLRAWGVPGERIHVVPNGIDAARFRFDPAARAAVRARLGIGPDAFVVGGVGRLVPGKRFDLLLHAVAAVPGAYLVLAGDGPERYALHALACRLGLMDRVRFLGECAAPGAPAAVSGPGVPAAGSGSGAPAAAPGSRVPPAAAGPAAGIPRPPARRPGVPDVLSALDVFVSASREEAFGLAVVEALAAGLPVLHTVCPAVDDLPPAMAPGCRRVGGSAGELAAALRRRRDSGEGRPAVPAAVRHYDIASGAARLTRLYERVLADPHHPIPPIERART
ncbi:glycosyltransferase [Streptomyces sp. NPDC014894]|uniref:glycosyltransferase n=1 Tax=Streptomyces sp. NPDC014894 TaxID=3364931 RepID=UPI0036FD3598